MEEDDKLMTSGKQTFFVDKEIQCNIQSTPSFGFHDCKCFANKQERYSTNVNGMVNDLSIGPHIYGSTEGGFMNHSTSTSCVESNPNNLLTESRNSSLGDNSQYNTKIQISTTENRLPIFHIKLVTHNYGPTFQLDPEATKEFTSRNICEKNHLRSFTLGNYF